MTFSRTGTFAFCFANGIKVDTTFTLHGVIILFSLDLIKKVSLRSFYFSH